MEQEQNALSILIPTYNYCCLSLVESLHTQATAQDDLSFEILVADAASTSLLPSGSSTASSARFSGDSSVVPDPACLSSTSINSVIS